MSERTYEAWAIRESNGNLMVDRTGGLYWREKDALLYCEEETGEEPVRVRVTVEIIEPGSVLGAEAPAGGEDGA